MRLNQKMIKHFLIQRTETLSVILPLLLQLKCLQKNKSTGILVLLFHQNILFKIAAPSFEVFSVR